MSKPGVLYARADGRLVFLPKELAGLEKGLPVISGNREDIENAVAKTAEPGESGHSYFVPAIGEAGNDKDSRINAVLAYRETLVEAMAEQTE